LVFLEHVGSLFLGFDQFGSVLEHDQSEHLVLLYHTFKLWQP
jgi:hypothetical protein